MNILYITMDPLEKDTSANIRNRNLIEGLVEQGNKVDSFSLKANTYIKSDFDDFLQKRYFLKTNKLYRYFNREQHNQNHLNYYQIKNNFLKNGLKIAIKNFLNFFVIYDLQKINVNQKFGVEINIAQYDLVISSSDPKSSHLIAERLLKNKSPVYWIQYWGDPMLNDITVEYKRGFKRALVKREEKRILNKADRVYYASPFTLDIQKKIYSDVKDKMDYILQVCAKRNENQNEKKGDNITLCYAGNYTSQIRSIEKLCQVVSERDNLTLVVAGKGECDIINENINYCGSVSYQKAQELEEEADIIICICNKNGTQIPGKIYYAASYQKPIIVILGEAKTSEFKEYFLTFNRYIICENNEEQITQAIEQAVLQILSHTKFDIPIHLTKKFAATKMLGFIQRKEIKND